MWIVPAVVLIISLILGPLLISDVAFAEKFPEKFVPDRLLIKFKKDVTNSQQNKLLIDNGGSVLAEIKALDIKLIKVPAHALEKIQASFAKNNAVEYVEKDYLFEPAIIPNDPNFANQWHLQAINVENAWDVSQGSSNIPIAILDTGVDPNHPDLQGKLTLGYNFFNNNGDWSDVCGHGTTVAGTAAAITNNGIGVSGVAWNNPIIPIRITDTNCYGYYSSMISGITYAADNGARVANISFAIFNGAALSDAAQYMNDHGGWVVAAAGNSGKLENYSENPYIISVSATGSTDSITSWSSYGPYVDFAAPGSSIYTTRNGGTYATTSGTSFSSPIVAGVVALVLSNDPTMTSAQAYDALKNSAVDKGTAGWDNYYGWGIVDASGALGENNNPPIDTTPPTATITSPQNGAQVSDIFTVSVDSSDNVSVNVVELYLDGTLYDQKTSLPYDFILDANTMSEGNHEIKAVSIDSSGNSDFDTITVNVVQNSNEPSPPNVSITNPADGSIVNGRLTITATVSGMSGATVKFFVDDTLKKTLTTEPFEYRWHTKGQAAGSHSISVEATDAVANTVADTVNVLIEEKGKGPGKPNKKKNEIESESLLGISEIPEFGKGVIIVSSSSSTAAGIITWMHSSLDSTEITNLGQSVSEAAKLHQMLAQSSKAEKQEFQDLFHQFKNAVEEKLGMVMGAEKKMIQQDLRKAEIKIESQIEKIEQAEQRENQIKTSIQFIKLKEDLQKIRNKIGILDDFRYNGDDNEKTLEELRTQEIELLQKTMIQEAQQNGKKLTENDIKKIEEEVEEKAKTSSKSENGNNDDKDNNKNDESSSPSEKSNNGNSNKGKSENSNKGGKGKSKK